MKLRKIMAGVVAAATAVSTLAITTFAFPDDTDFKAEKTDPGLAIQGNNWLVQLYNTGNPDENKPPVEYEDVDLSKVTGCRVTFHVLDDGMSREAWDGSVGGCIVFSVNGGDIGTSGDLYNKYNWPGSAEFWGVTDEELGIETTAEKPLTVKTLGDYTYQVEMNNLLPNPFVEDADSVKEIGCFQVCWCDWGSAMCAQHVDYMEILDTDGNVLIAFDELGKRIDPTEIKLPEPQDTESKTEESEDESAAESEEESAVESEEESSVAEESSEAEESVEESSAAPETSAPAASAVESTTSNAPTQDNTGLIVGIIIAAVVVVAVVVAVVVVMKKKKS